MACFDVQSSSDDLRAQTMIAAVDASRSRLQTDVIDLYYIHRPRTGKDLRPLMEGLETARQQGKIHAIGVSNFSVAQMEQLAEVGRIDAHQLGYNLLWRFAERDIIPTAGSAASPSWFTARWRTGFCRELRPPVQFVAGDQR
ncbi:MAG: aldo/keto reductase [Anaerolineae bacterium]